MNPNRERCNGRFVKSPSYVAKTYQERNRAWSRTFKGRFSQLVRKARQYGKEVTITVEQYKELFDKPCYYCGGALPECGHGLDRQDNRRGYHFDNVVPCCYDCNFKKGAIEAAGFTFPRSVELMKELMRK